MTRLACTSLPCASRYGFMPGNGFFISDCMESTVPPSAWQCRTWPVSTAIGACPRVLSEVYFGNTSGHVATAMEEPILAARLGTTTHLSPLLRKARRLGLGPGELEILAVQRDCRHYSNGTEPEEPLASEREFSNEELAKSRTRKGWPLHHPF